MSDHKLSDSETAKRAYEGYGEYVGWTTYDGHLMPNWDDLPSKIRGAWMAACGAAAAGSDDDYDY